MKMLPKLVTGLGGLLKKPGDKFVAEVSQSGNQIVKIATVDIKRTLVRYPETGTVVETIVHKANK